MAEKIDLDSLIAKCKVDQLDKFAQMVETTDRFQDMVKIMHKLVSEKIKKEEELTTDERNLLSVAYKNVVGTLRQTWRTFDQDQQEDDKNKAIAKDYKAKIEKELEEVCRAVLDVLEKLYKQVKDKTEKADKECQVFYLKMKGDYYRYLTEVFNENESYKKGCEESYKDATKIAEDFLDTTHPTRLGLALNFSVCYYEILKKKKEACELAKAAFDAAIEQLDSLNDTSYKDSTLIMQLLRDNLTIWNQESNDGDEPEDDAAKDTAA